MTNYNTAIEQATTIEEVEVLFARHKDDILNNAECKLDESVVKKALETINKGFENAFTTDFLIKFNADRQTAFNDLLDNPSFIKYNYKLEKGVYTLSSTTALFKFETLEKAFQLLHSTETDGKGNPKPNTTVTIFGALRFYGLMSSFIRNLQKGQFDSNEENGYNLENVIIDGKKIFEKGEGECFKAHSNTALDKQVNIIVKKMFGYDITVRKNTELPILKLKAVKIKQDKKTAEVSVNAIIDDKSILKFADFLFGVLVSIKDGKTIEVKTSKANKAE